MGLACSQIRLLTLTTRKADCELGISLDSIEKMALTREQSALSSEYYSKLQAKKVCYYANGQYSKMTYDYLMGNTGTYAAIVRGDQSNTALKSDNAMILADYKGQVIMSDNYATVLTSVLGASAMDQNGRGGTFSQDKIPAIIAKITGYKEDDISAIVDNKNIESRSYNTTATKTLKGESTDKKGTTDNTDTVQSELESIVDFYLPIFRAAAANGWTTEYNKEMALNDDYVSDAIVTGSFQLEHVNDVGDYDEGTTLTYFVTSGAVQTRTDSDTREEITAWYNAEKERIAEKENYIDMHMSDLSTELEAINTEIQSIQSYIDDAIQSVFDWGAG